MLRKASIRDIRKIHAIINGSAASGEMLPRSLGELYDNMRDYYVYEDRGEAVGTCALHICWEDLAEIRSLCVAESSRKKGVGRMLVDECINEARDLGIPRIFVLTYQELFFNKCGFRVVDKKELPQKIWSDCIRCPKFPECDEIAMTMEVGNKGDAR
ncbi:MAG: Amino-acid acetyltransferase [Syntrophorhabdus sp. PtaU1.Bin002]|nr:MAG: Amino-acid acetyltransferase [Syntrophorhabdus sp. PtaU1.Bin002]